VQFRATSSSTSRFSTCARRRARHAPSAGAKTGVPSVRVHAGRRQAAAGRRALLYAQGGPRSKKRVAPVMAGSVSMCTLTRSPAAAASAAAPAAASCSRSSAAPARPERSGPALAGACAGDVAGRACARTAGVVVPRRRRHEQRQQKTGGERGAAGPVRGARRRRRRAAAHDARQRRRRADVEQRQHGEQEADLARPGAAVSRACRLRARRPPRARIRRGRRPRAARGRASLWGRLE